MNKPNDKIIGIYKITSPSGRVYIGQSTDCHQRKIQYKCSKAKNQQKLHASIVKYGWENHLFEVIHICEEERLNDLEIHYSNIYKSLDQKLGLNIRFCGGAKGKHSELTKQKLRRPKSIEHRRKLSISKMGKPSNLKGKKASLEKINKMRIANIGKRYSTEINQKKGLKLDKHHNYGKGTPVIQMDLLGNHICEFTSANRAEVILNINAANIRKCASKKIPTAYGFKWEFKKN